MSNFKYIELFSGIGGFRSALDLLGGNCVFASEIDSFATQSYRALYNGAPELHGDITQIDTHDIPDHDVLVGGFPCQAFSVAGQRKGFEEARGTLFFEIARIASAKHPRLMLLENVKGLLSHDGGKTFDVMCAVLNDIGYAIDFRVLNSKHYGVPQNRERIFIMCDRDADHADWTIEGNGVEAKAKRRAQDMWIRTFNFDWPTNDTVTTRLRDILEDNVDERYYLSEEKTAALVAQLEENAKGKGALFNPTDDEWNIDSDEIKFVGMLGEGFRQINEVLDINGVCTALRTFQGGGLEPKIVVLGNVDAENPNQNTVVYDSEGLAPTLRNQHGYGVPKIAEDCVNDRGSIRTNPEGVANAIDANYTKGLDNHGQRTHVLASDDVPSWIPKPDDINRTLRTGGKGSLSDKHNYEHIAEEIRPVLTPDRPEKRQNGRRFKDDDEESFTLTAQDRHGIAIGHYPRYRIRKLTPLECWRLQGFTDEQFYTAKYYSVEEAKAILLKYLNHKGKRVMDDKTRVERMSDSQLYKQAGNAVTVSVISALAEKLCQRLPVTDDEFEAMLA